MNSGDYNAARAYSLSRGSCTPIRALENYILKKLYNVACVGVKL